MAALTKERDTPSRGAADYVQPLRMKGNTKIYAGAGVSTDATGYAVPAGDVAATQFVGRANATVDTTAAGPDGLLADGIKQIEVAVGIFEWNNPSGANQLTQVDVGKLAYVLTDNEFTRAAGTTNSRIGGRVYDVDVANAKVSIDTRVHAV